MNSDISQAFGIDCGAGEAVNGSETSSCTSVRPCPCGCGVPVPAVHGRMYASDRCRLRAWAERQCRLDFTPAASDLAHAVRGRESKAQRILARLRIAPATSIELAKITHRFSARIYELRKAGHRITREDHVHDGHEWSVYTLET